MLGMAPRNPKSTIRIVDGQSSLRVYNTLGTNKVLDARRRGAPTRRINNTPQGEAIEGNAADDSLMVDQGAFIP